MKMYYKGSNADCDYRNGILEFKEKEIEKVEKILSEIEKIWNVSRFEEMALISVDDKEDYEEMKSEYIKYKKLF